VPAVSPLPRPPDEHATERDALTPPAPPASAARPRASGISSKGSAAARAEFDPTLFLFDHVPGGVGLAERMYEIAGKLLGQTRMMIAACPCEAGCPACVGPTELTAQRKTTSLLLLSRMIGDRNVTMLRRLVGG
jgi:ATP-dependent helicase YprA (DUF1998 family)